MKKLVSPFIVSLLVCGNASSQTSTVRCQDKPINSTFELNGETYLVVDDVSIRDKANMDALTAGTLRYCTSHATDMSRLFYENNDFNRPIGDWDTSRVTDMSEMFRHASTFNQPINSWDTSRVESFKSTFYAAREFNQPLNQWDLSSAQTLRGMFFAAYSFDQPIGGWDTSRVTDMTYMFKSAWGFNQPLNDWDTSQVTSMAMMFRDAERFNQPLNDWNTSEVEDMSRMFYRAAAFDQDLSSWNVDKVKDSQGYSAESSLSKNHLPVQFLSNIKPIPEYSGIGLVVHKPAAYVIVQLVAPNGPAGKSGEIKAGDRIVGIAKDGENLVDVVGWSIEEVAEAIRGPVGSKVKLELLDEVKKLRTVVIERGKLDQSSFD